MQPLGGVGHLVLADQVVPLGNEVGERAAFVAEGDAAIHAAPCLVAQVLRRERLVDLPPVPDPQLDRAARRALARVAQEASRVSHVPPP
jgi:hypothetical protein